MAKLSNTFSQINTAISNIVTSLVSLVDLQKLAAITVSAANINSTSTSFLTEVTLNEANADEYAGGKLDTSLTEFTIDISGESFTNAEIIAFIPWCGWRMAIKSCSSDEIVITNYGYGPTSEIPTGLKFQLRVRETIA